MAHNEFAMALWEEESGKYILDTSLCSLICLHSALANTDADRHSVGLSWQRGGPGEAFQDTPHEGKTELQFWAPSTAVPHL